MVLRLLLLFFQILLFLTSSTPASVFQGDCSSSKVLCEQLCLTISPETYECSCWEGHVIQNDGLSCKVDTVVQYSVDRQESSKNYLKPTSSPISLRDPLHLGKPLSFKGNNYAEFPINDNAYLETNITIQFKLEEQKDGILLFAGQLAGDDFISITLDGPNVIMRHDCGEGTIEDMYHGTFGIGEWHEVNVWRQNCDRTQMKLDEGRRLVDQADEFKNYKGITMDEGVFIGAAPNNIEYLKEKTGTSDGFRGCIRYLAINGEVLLDATNQVNKAFDAPALYHCGTLGSEDNNRKNKTLDGIEMFDLTQRGIPQIREEPKAIEAIKLKTSSSRLEKDKEKERSVSDLLDTSTSTTSPSTSDLSISTTTTSTSDAVVEKSWKIAHFNGSSRLFLAAPASILSYLELSIQFKTESPTGTLFYWNEDDKFIAVTIESSFIKVYASLGMDTTVLRSENVISLYHWHKLEVWRSGKGILLKINKQNWVESELHGEKIDDVLQSTGSIHIGSFEKMPEVVRHLDGFQGCVKRIRLNGKLIPLSTSISTGVTECSTDPCSSFGCPRKCVAHNSLPVCSCEWPSMGSKCQEYSESDLSSMAFNGFSHLELDDEAVMSHVTGENLDLAINFKLRNTSIHLKQILVSAGDIAQEDDFFELSIDPNRLARFAINLGSGSVVLTHPKRIDDERWTTVEVIRKKQEIKLSVNGEDPITAYAPSGAQQLNVYRNIFVGNTVVSDTPDGRDFTGLHGCVISIRFDQTVISHPKQAKSAINIEDCAI